MSENDPTKGVSKDPEEEPRERSVEDAYGVTLVRPSDDQADLQEYFDQLTRHSGLSPGNYLLLAVRDMDDGTKHAIIGPADMDEKEITRFNEDSEEFFFGETFDYLHEVPLEFLKETPLN